jgi:SAM-dependent methyltransferase
MGDLFDAAAMYDEDYLHFFAAPDDRSELASHGPVVPGADLPGAAAAELAWRLAELRPGMSVLPWTGGFDRVLNWSTAFGYFDDTTNRAVLDGIARVLRPAGRLAMDLDNLTAFLASYCPSRVVAARDNGDMLVDRYHLDALTGRFEAERTVIRSGRTRRVNFVKRLFGFPELRDWLLAAGFTAVASYGEDGQPLTADHKRMVIVADLP